MTLEERTGSFAELGQILRDSLEGNNIKYSGALQNLIETQVLKNPWFTPDNVRMAVSAIAEELTPENIGKWVSAYPEIEDPGSPLNVAVVMAGNIPLVGFHDFLSVLISGNNILAKPSSRDPDLIKFLAGILTDINPLFEKRIAFTDTYLKGFDAVIATGSNNSSRYFDYYFGKYPHIIRKNRNSVAVLTGNENDEEIINLGKDVFSYFGLGCRSVSKIFIPEGYDPDKLFPLWDEFADIINHHKYANNYDYNKAVYLVNRESFRDTGYLLMKENESLSSPVAVLYYEYYREYSQLSRRLESLKDKIQCITGREHIPFGKAQSPHLWDYADGIDTIEFLSKKIFTGLL